MDPTRCRIVLVTDEKGEEFPAIVLDAHGPKCISVNAFTYAGPRVMTSLMLYEPGISPTKNRTWHWPGTSVPATAPTSAGATAPTSVGATAAAPQNANGATQPGSAANPT